VINVSKYVNDAITASGCNEGLINAMFSYFDSLEGKNFSDVVEMATTKYDLSPVIIVNVFRIWQQSKAA
jgi:DNA-binding protein Fis